MISVRLSPIQCGLAEFRRLGVEFQGGERGNRH
jgi:hypothetical protein